MKRKVEKWESTITVIEYQQEYYLKSLSTKKNNITYANENPGPDLGQAQKGVKLVNGIPTALLITGSLMAIQHI